MTTDNLERVNLKLNPTSLKLVGYMKDYPLWDFKLNYVSFGEQERLMMSRVVQGGVVIKSESMNWNHYRWGRWDEGQLEEKIVPVWHPVGEEFLVKLKAVSDCASGAGLYKKPTHWFREIVGELRSIEAAHGVEVRNLASRLLLAPQDRYMDPYQAKLMREVEEQFRAQIAELKAEGRGLDCRRVEEKISQLRDTGLFGRWEVPGG